MEALHADAEQLSELASPVMLCSCPMGSLPKGSRVSSNPLWIKPWQTFWLIRPCRPDRQKNRSRPDVLVAAGRSGLAPTYGVSYQARRGFCDIMAIQRSSSMGAPASVQLLPLSFTPIGIGSISFEIAVRRRVARQ